MNRDGLPGFPTVAKQLGDDRKRIKKLEFRRSGTGSGTRIVSGALYNDATIIAGTGFTAEWADEDGSSPSAHLITVRFDSPFSEPGPIVALAANNNNPADVEGEYVVSLKTRDPEFIVVEGKELDGTASIGGFDFLAVEAAA